MRRYLNPKPDDWLRLLIRRCGRTFSVSSTNFLLTSQNLSQNLHRLSSETLRGGPVCVLQIIVLLQNPTALEHQVMKFSFRIFW